VIFWDSSAIVPLLLLEGDTPRRREQLKEDAVMVVWWGSRVECESAIERHIREGGLDAAKISLARARMGELEECWHEIPPSSKVRRLAIRLLRTHPLRSADALQLAAALSLLEDERKLSMPFLTADHRLAQAAEIEGLTVLR